VTNIEQGINMASGANIFEHKMRKIVFNYVSINPGVSFNKIQNIVEMNSSTLRYHLAYLEKARLVKCIRDGRQNCYYPVPENVIDLNPLTGVDTKSLTKDQKRILRTIKKQPGIGVADLTGTLKISKKKLNYNIQRLIELKLIWKIKVDGQTGFEQITKDQMKKEIVRKLVKRLLAKEIKEDTFFKLMKKIENY
jgi:predicted transcriptional regulator